MKIWHRVSFDRRYEDILQRLGIEYEKGATPAETYSSVVFSIHENHPGWPEIKRIVDEIQSFDFPYTSFDNEEILASEWVRLCPGFERGYPQPQGSVQKSVWDKFRWRCISCGLSCDQQTPFRINKEIRMGRYDFVSLYWTYSILCTQRVVDRIQETELLGVEIWPVMLHREDVPSQVLSQLIFPYVTQPGLDARDKRAPELCPECGITKYGFHRRGYMHIERAALRSDVDAQRTNEWFGSDTKWGFQEILISNRFAQLILEEGWKGVSLKAVKLV